MAWTLGRLSIVVSATASERRCSCGATQISSTGISPGLGNIARCGHDATLWHPRGWGAVCEDMPGSGMWSKPQSRLHINRLELEAVFLALKDFRLSSKGFSAAARTAACTDSHRQHVCGLVHKSPRRRMLQGSVQAGSESPAIGGL